MSTDVHFDRFISRIVEAIRGVVNVEGFVDPTPDTFKDEPSWPNEVYLNDKPFQVFFYWDYEANEPYALVKMSIPSDYVSTVFPEIDGEYGELAGWRVYFSDL